MLTITLLQKLSGVEVEPKADNHSTEKSSGVDGCEKETI
jgi:hypothetical protein